MTRKNQNLIIGFSLLSILAGLPLLGVALSGGPVRRYLEFPPVTHYVKHASFSWPIFVGLAAAILIVTLPFIVHVAVSPSQPDGISSSSTLDPRRSRHPRSTRSSFPVWGWLGFVLGVGFWVLAWTRFPWFALLQPFTFSPLWFSYIIVVNALVQWRTGQCMMLKCTRRFLWLFPISAGFWWFFEYINRFVQNWHYVGVEGLTPLKYFVFATLPFSTVLPAVLGTYELLSSFPSSAAGLERFIPIQPSRPKVIATGTLVLFCTGLIGIGIWPDYLFPLLWIAPAFIIGSLQCMQGRDTILAPLRSGNWQRIFRLALAALLCGFFWEMWNFHSMAKWIYAVPFVNRFHVFEMPLLGYAGYMPFGIECAVVSDMMDQFLAEDLDTASRDAP